MSSRGSDPGQAPAGAGSRTVITAVEVMSRQGRLHGRDGERGTRRRPAARRYAESSDTGTGTSGGHKGNVRSRADARRMAWPRRPAAMRTAPCMECVFRVVA